MSREIYKALQEIVKPIHSHSDQLMAISEWIEGRFDCNKGALNNQKSKVLVSYYRGEGGHKTHRVYLEKDFEQAEKDLNLILEADSLGKEWELQDSELYNCK